MWRAAVVLVALLTACGGSGALDTTTSSPPPPPLTTTSVVTSSTAPATTTTTSAPIRTTTTTLPVVAPTFGQLASGVLARGEVWSIPVATGEGIAYSVESGGSVVILPMTSDLAAVGSPFAVAGSAVGGEPVADHKHIVQGGAHFVTWSNRSADSLQIAKMSPDGTELARVTVSTEAPTNDMLMFGDGDRVYVGKFLPGIGHEITVYDSDLNQVDRFEVGGGGPGGHANGAVAVVGGRVGYLVAPDTLGPGENGRYRLFRFDLDGSPAGREQTILNDPGRLGLVTGRVHDDRSGVFLLFYVADSGDGTGDIHMTSFDPDWELLDDVVVAAGAGQRPHAALVGDDLYVGYDAGGSSRYVWLVRTG